MSLNFFNKKTTVQNHPLLPETNPGTFKLGPKTIKIEKIPAGATLEMLQAVEKLSAVGENVADSLTAFCEVAAILAKREDKEITTEWLLENADLNEVTDLACWGLNRINDAFDEGKNPQMAQLMKRLGGAR